MLYELTGREVDPQQEPVNSGSDLRQARRRQCALILENFGRDLLPGLSQRDRKASEHEHRDSPQTDRFPEHGASYSRYSLLI